MRVPSTNSCDYHISYSCADGALLEPTSRHHQSPSPSSTGAAASEDPQVPSTIGRDAIRGLPDQDWSGSSSCPRRGDCDEGRVESFDSAVEQKKSKKSGHSIVLLNLSYLFGLRSRVAWSNQAIWRGQIDNGQGREMIQSPVGIADVSSKLPSPLHGNDRYSIQPMRIANRSMHIRDIL